MVYSSLYPCVLYLRRQASNKHAARSRHFPELLHPGVVCYVQLHEFMSGF